MSSRRHQMIIWWRDRARHLRLIRCEWRLGSRPVDQVGDLRTLGRRLRNIIPVIEHLPNAVTARFPRATNKSSQTITVPPRHSSKPVSNGPQSQGTEPAQHGQRYRDRPVIAPVTRAMRLVQGSEASVIRASRSSEREPEGAAYAGVSPMNAQVSQPARIDPSARPAAWRETGRATHLDHKTAGQAPLSVGSRIATHSTCEVIEKMSAWTQVRKQQVRGALGSRMRAAGRPERQMSVTVLRQFGIGNLARHGYP